MSSYKAKNPNAKNFNKNNLPQITNITNINISLFSNNLSNTPQNASINNTINAEHINKDIIIKNKNKNKPYDFYSPSQNFFSGLKNFVSSENPIYNVKTADSKTKNKKAIIEVHPHTSSEDKQSFMTSKKTTTKKLRNKLYNNNSAYNLIPLPLLSNTNSQNFQQINNAKAEQNNALKSVGNLIINNNISLINKTHEYDTNNRYNYDNYPNNLSLLSQCYRDDSEFYSDNKKTTIEDNIMKILNDGKINDSELTILVSYS